MKDTSAQYAGFLDQVQPEHRGFVIDIHNMLMENNCKVKYASNAKGSIVSYTHRKTKMGILTFSFQNKNIIARHLIMDVNDYIDFMYTLPQDMQDDITNSSSCGVIADPPGCNPNCHRGLKFTFHGVDYVKCKYGCFNFEISDIGKPYIKQFLDMELESIEQRYSKGT